MKILIIGAGKIGGHAAYGLLKYEQTQHITLVGRDPNKTRGLCQDLKEAFPRKSIETCELSGIQGSFDLTLLAFSTLIWTPEINVNDRLIEARSNTAILKQIYLKTGFQNMGTILVVSNPVDVLVSFIADVSGYTNVIGVGLSIDEQRISGAVNELFGLQTQRVPCIGEHGPTVTPLLSRLSWSVPKEEALYDQVRNKSFEATSVIIRNLSIPLFGPLYALEMLLQAIICEEDKIISASYYLKEPLLGVQNIAIGLPVVFQKGKITGFELPDISPVEIGLFKKSAGHIRKNYLQTYE